MGHRKRKPKERVENEYKDRSNLERESIVEYFSKHPDFGSDEWYDSDAVLKGRNLSESKKCGQIAQQDAPFRCSRCKRAWQFVGAHKTKTEKIMYLAPSVWKNIPLTEKICYWCDQYLSKKGEMWTSYE